MSDSFRLAILLVTAALTVPQVAPAQGRMPWTTTLERALEIASERDSLVMVSIRAPGERGSDELAEVHDRDPRLLRLAGQTANLMITVTGAEDRSPSEQELRERFLAISTDGPLLAPHHVFLDPREGGRLISSATGRLTPGQLEWIWADALGRVTEDFSWPPSDRTRAPRSLRYATADGATGTLPPTDEAVDAAIDALKRGGGMNRDAINHYRTILSSGSPTALKFGRTELRRMNGMMQRVALETIGEVSPTSWADFPIDALTDRSASTRESAVRALEKLATPTARAPLMKALRGEDSLVVRGRILRALATCAADDRSVVGQIDKALRDRDAAIRLQAMMAFGDLEDDQTVARAVERGLDDPVADVRTAAAWVVASRREPELRPLLDAARIRESDPEVNRWLDAATEVLDTPADLSGFDEFTAGTAGDRQVQDAMSRLREFGRGRGRGRGADEDPERDEPGAGADPRGGRGGGEGGGRGRR